MFARYFKVLGVLLLGAWMAAPAQAVTYQIDIGSASGTFEAPGGGGLLSAFDITIDGVTFDTLGMGVSAPVYNAIDNDIRGNPSTEGYVLNSAAGGACAALSCILALEDSTDPGVVPPLYAIFPLIDGVPDTVTGAGEYAISQVPLSAGAGLLAFGGLVLGWVGRRRRAG